MVQDVRFKKGQILEKRISVDIHQNNPVLVYPVLIDQKLLRDFDCGQIDLCTIERCQKFGNYLKIYEVKSFLSISRTQKARIFRSGEFLCYIFGLPVRFEIITADF